MPMIPLCTAQSGRATPVPADQARLADLVADRAVAFQELADLLPSLPVAADVHHAVGLLSRPGRAPRRCCLGGRCDMASQPSPDRSRGTGTSGRSDGAARASAAGSCRRPPEWRPPTPSPRWPSSFSRWLKSCSNRIVSLNRPQRSTTTRRSRGMPSSSRAR